MKEQLIKILFLVSSLMTQMSFAGDGFFDEEVSLSDLSFQISRSFSPNYYTKNLFLDVDLNENSMEDYIKIISQNFLKDNRSFNSNQIHSVYVNSSTDMDDLDDYFCYVNKHLSLDIPKLVFFIGVKDSYKINKIVKLCEFYNMVRNPNICLILIADVNQINLGYIKNNSKMHYRFNLRMKLVDPYLKLFKG